jgi:hypothetical protein
MDVQMDGRYAYAVSLYGGLHVLELSNPADPKLLSSIKPENPGCRAVVLADGLAYLACKPERPVHCVMFLHPKTRWHSAAAGPRRNDLAGVGGGIISMGLTSTAQGLVAIDVSDPRNPEKWESLP